jgi:diacylglycerol kinase family enzyme
MLARAANGGIRGILGDMLGSFIALLYVLGRYRPSDFAVRCDESERVHRQVINIAIGRTRYIASGMKVDRTLDMQDAGLHVLIIKNLTPTRIPRVLSQLYRGDIRSDCESVFLTRGKHVTLFAGRRETELEFDGDPRGQLPCTITAAEPLDIIGANLS